MNGIAVDELICEHLAVVLIGVTDGSDDLALAVARSETNRLVEALALCLNGHPLDGAGRCGTCGTADCVLRQDIRSVLRPVGDGPRTSAEEDVLWLAAYGLRDDA
ncbi:hypothetical protein AB0I60_04270 [Actinosynnema sp. NPDC050436]|uniref:hypothetical protein n=1 Tax=Actinosynnema sp. NPDC050436 TaxID=3155659 RepID=UPI0033F3D068